MIEMNQPTATEIAAADLSYIERLILYALRQWVADEERWPDVVLEFNRSCGPRAATRICEALQSTFRTLGLHARRQIRLHPLICCRVSPDELCLLNILAAHQSQSAFHGQAMINWLVSRNAAGALRSDIDLVARGLFEAGYMLDVRRAPEIHTPRLEQTTSSVH
ncbi:MAG: hypothetical protein OSB67_07270 [Alphaproteobacteria bacterium]|nr:hypothetical protein [Alphaproteobacteria bacterium]